jgi:hypothetical protein
LDYIKELAQLIGWVYDADGDGVRQFWEPEHNRVVASTFCNFFGQRQIGPDVAHRVKTGRDIRNHITVVGYEDKNKEVPREYFHKASLARYGDRYGRVNQPLVRTAEASDKLGKALLRDFAYAGNSLTSMVQGDFDIDRPWKIFTHHEEVRTHLTKAELWALWQVDTEMTVAGKGKYSSTLSGRAYASSRPDPVSAVVGTGGAGKIDVSWTANAEVDIDGYYVYWSTAANGAFTKRTKVTSASDSIGSLSDGTAYWFYVTAINLGGVESEPSAIVRCVAGAGNSGTEQTTWGITDLALTLTDNDPSVLANVSWTPAISATPDYIIASLIGPSKVSPPLAPAQQAKVTIANGVVQHYYANFSKAQYESASTHYFKIVLYEVVINDVHFHFGAPLVSNIASGVWP